MIFIYYISQLINFFSFLFFIVIIFFFEHRYFMPNIWVLHKPSKKNQLTFYASNVGIAK